MKLNIHTQNYFPINFIALGLGLFAMGFLVVKSYLWLTPILLVVGLILMSTHYRIKIDFKEKNYRDYLWILGFKNGETKSFEKADFLFVSSSKYSQTYGSIAVRFHSGGTNYEGYLKLDDINLFLGENSVKDSVKNKLEIVGKKTGLEIKDFTSDK